MMPAHLRSMGHPRAGRIGHTDRLACYIDATQLGQARGSAGDDEGGLPVKRGFLVLVCLAVLLAACGGGAGDDVVSGSAAPTPTLRPLQIQVVFEGTPPYGDLGLARLGDADGAECGALAFLDEPPEGPFAFLEAGAEVRVVDESGATLGIGVLPRGSVSGSGSRGPDSFDCTWQVSVPDVPDAASYTVSIGGEDLPVRSRAELEEAGWVAEYVLGR